MTHNFWDNRFKQDGYAYGDEPNLYYKGKLDALTPGKILFPLEGEGRNCVYAAEKGWEVSAFDQSVEGKKKALYLAIKKVVLVDYLIAEIETVDYEPESFDVLVLVFAHFSSENRAKYHRKLASYLKKGGTLILEGFSKNHLANQRENPSAGGPKDVDMLYDVEELKSDFEGFEFMEAQEVDTVLHEGNYHEGKAKVVRLFAKKR